MVRPLGILGALAVCACEAPPAVAPDGGPPGDADLGQLECGPTLKPVGKACVPVLESCPGQQVPLPGGGCQKVGVEPCVGGLKGPPDWTCKPVGPPRTCLAGWAMTGHGWCEPVLPDRRHPCPDGTMEVIGKKECQPIADCGSGTWGNIKLTAETLFVDQGYTGAYSDGSQAKPFTSVADALLALPADRDAHVAVAAGVYPAPALFPELVVYSGSVVIEGRCPQMVRLESPVYAEKSNVTLRGLTVSTDTFGVAVVEGVALLDHVAVIDCSNVGVTAEKSSVVLRDTLVAGNHNVGVGSTAGQLTLERSVIRDTKQLVDDSGVGWNGVGLVGPSSTLLVRDSLIATNHVSGVSVSGGVVHIERSVVRGTRPCQEDNRHGNGLLARGQASVEVADSLIADNHAAGVMVTGKARATLERVVIRDTLPQWPTVGEGIHAAEGASLVLRRSVVARNQGAGVWIKGADATIEGSLIQDTRASADGTGGQGINVEQVAQRAPPKLGLRESIVRRNRSAGVWVYGGEATIEESLVQDTRPRELDGYYGFGVLALGRLEPGGVHPASVALKGSTIAGSPFGGLAVYGSSATLERSVVRDTKEPEARRWGGPGVLASSLGGEPSVLALKQSLVTDSSDVGVLVEGSRATLEGSAVLRAGTRLGDGGGGAGIYAWPGKDRVPTDLKLLDCQVEKSGSVGVQAVSTPLEVQRSMITGSVGDAVGFGDGVVVQGADARLELLDSLVQDSERCGIVAVGAAGLVDRSLIARNALSVMVDGPLDLGSRVELLGNTDDRVTFGEKVATPPSPALPPPPEPLVSP